MTIGVFPLFTHLPSTTLCVPGFVLRLTPQVHLPSWRFRWHSSSGAGIAWPWRTLARCASFPERGDRSSQPGADQRQCDPRRSSSLLSPFRRCCPPLLHPCGPSSLHTLASCSMIARALVPGGCISMTLPYAQTKGSSGLIGPIFSISTNEIQCRNGFTNSPGRSTPRYPQSRLYASESPSLACSDLHTRLSSLSSSGVRYFPDDWQARLLRSRPASSRSSANAKARPKTWAYPMPPLTTPTTVISSPGATSMSHCPHSTSNGVNDRYLSLSNASVPPSPHLSSPPPRSPSPKTSPLTRPPPLAARSSLSQGGGPFHAKIR